MPTINSEWPATRAMTWQQEKAGAHSQDVGRDVPKLGHRTRALPLLCDQTLSFVLANLRFVDSAIEMIDRFLAMAMKIALSLLQMLPGASHRFYRLVYVGASILLGRGRSRGAG
jgi:hypothetical protein